MQTHGNLKNLHLEDMVYSYYFLKSKIKLQLKKITKKDFNLTR